MREFLWIASRGWSEVSLPVGIASGWPDYAAIAYGKASVCAIALGSLRFGANEFAVCVRARLVYLAR